MTAAPRGGRKLDDEQRSEVRRRAAHGEGAVAANKALAAEFGITYYAVKYLRDHPAPDPDAVRKTGPRLTAEQRDEIRQRGAMGKGAYAINRALAEEYGITISAVRHIIRTPHDHATCANRACKCSPHAMPADELARLRRAVGLPV